MSALRWLHRVALGLLQRRCKHPPETVSYDITERDNPLTRIAWCRICGAHRHGDKANTWNPCRADWWRNGNDQ